jgi:hypothetical protein
MLLAGLMWGISWLLDAQRIDRAPGSDEEPSTPTSPAAAAAPMEAGKVAVALPLAAVMPLGPEDEGSRVIVRGTVLGQPLDDGFWILADEDEVLFVRTTQPATTNQDLTLTGTLHQIAAAEGAAWAARAKLREAAGWKVHRGLYLEAEMPGMTPTAQETNPQIDAAGTEAASKTPRDTT